ncbi:MAG: cytochrome c1, heme protein precursor [Rickettsiaceae bacterium]|jgi:ubiquinol-cytochrome c reductase cytochrome c1 subunit|nr:cytochrome c1, heme protein precursor [Rickettsiaceae bacterium]
MVKKFLLIINLVTFSSFAFANEEGATAALHPKQLKWEFDGFFGRFDKQSIQRGYQVYKEVCSSCHSMSLVAYRNLQEIGFSEEEVKRIASEYMVTDGPDDSGEMFERKALPSDRFVPPFANEQASRASNGGAFPPDLSLIVKARHDGANYVYSLLTGFAEAPEDFKMAEGKNYNPYFPGRQISMPPPIDDGTVEYKDGTVATKEQIAVDVVNFLQFAAEPEMEKRKKMGVAVMTFLAIMTLLFAIAKKLVWKKVK